MSKGSIYVVSKIRHAQLWRTMRQAGAPIISSWIDDGGPETLDFSKVWPKYLAEAAKADVMIVYTEVGDTLKGGLLEIGAALGGEARAVIFVGAFPEQFVTAQQHPRIEEAINVSVAIERAKQLVAEVKYEDSLWTVPLQRLIGEWVLRCFGVKSFSTLSERGRRVLEEAIELAQAAGVTEEDAAFLLHYVYARPVGELSQEVAGLSTTLLALAESAGIDLNDVVQQEVKRVLSLPVEHFKARLKRKVDAGVAIGESV